MKNNLIYISLLDYYNQQSYFLNIDEIKKRIQFFNELFGDKNDDNENLLMDLDAGLNNKLINLKNDKYSLNTEKIDYFIQVWTDFFKQKYSQRLQLAANSKAYKKLCEVIYGTDLVHFNMLCDKQLKKLMGSIPNSSETILDLGCGLGHITEYVAQSLETKVIGTDFILDSNTLTHIVSGQKITEYFSSDLNHLHLEKNTYDVIYLIDSINFASNITDLLTNVHNALTNIGTLIVFASFQFNLNSSVQNQRFSTLMNFLEENFTSSENCDFSENEAQIWNNYVKYLPTLKNQFIEENNLPLWQSLYNEAIRLLPEIQNSTRKRFMIVAKK